MPQETATLIPAHPLADHPFSAAPIETKLVAPKPLADTHISAADTPPESDQYVRIHDSRGGSHDLPVTQIANAQKIDPGLRLDLSNIAGWTLLGRLQQVSATQPVPPKAATRPHADPQNRSSMTIEPNAQSPKVPIIDKPAGTVALPPLPNVSQA